MMLSTLMLPGTVTMIPKYLIFNKMGWLNTYLPFIVPAALGSSAFLIYMVLQFIRGIPTELDESAKLDGCGSLRILIYLDVYKRQGIYKDPAFLFICNGPLLHEALKKRLDRLGAPLRSL